MSWDLVQNQPHVVKVISSGTVSVGTDQLGVVAAGDTLGLIAANDELGVLS